MNSKGLIKELKADIRKYKLESNSDLVHWFYVNYIDLTTSDMDFNRWRFLKLSDNCNANRRSQDDVLRLLSSRVDLVNVDF